MKVSAYAKSNYKGTLVSSQRWVPAKNLKKGMYVCELDVPWENTPFMFQGFFLESNEQVEAVQKYCDSALIKTEKIAARSVTSKY